LIILPGLFITACNNPAGGGENDGLTGIDIEDFGASASISRAFDVSSKADWDAAAAAIQTSGNNKNYVINLTADVALPGRGAASLFGSVTGITVSLRGEKTLRLDSGGAKGFLLTIGNNQTFLLRESVLVGRNDNDTSLVFVQGRFTMRSGEISGNTVNSTTTAGGGVFVNNANARFTMSGGEIHDNAADGNSGGGVFINNGSFEMTGGEIHGNTTTSSGGGVFVSSNGVFAINGGEIYDNTTAEAGGGVFVNSSDSAGGVFTMNGGKIHDNTTENDYRGGGVFVSSACVFTMSGGEIYANTAAGDGGGVSISSDSVFTMSGGKIYANTTAGSGGGVFVNSLNGVGGSFAMSNGEIYANTSAGAGGGVYINSDNGVGGSFAMSGGQIHDNATKNNYNGGGVFIGAGGIFTMTNGEIYKNTAGGDGGGVFVSVSGSFAMSRGVISGNTAPFGGGVFVYNGTFVKTGGTVYGDTDNIFGNGNDTDNTATDSSDLGTNGHAVFYTYYHYYYRNETLANDPSGNISSTDTLPIASGETLNNWTMR
jgi:hypothetical protein